MATNQLQTLVNFLRRISVPAWAAGQGDGQLLKLFVDQHDQAAFAALVQRHGPLVLGVCQRVLHNVHDAEDAFQATFLVLARKSKSILKRGSVGSWLHGVAFRVAARAKKDKTRRREREGKVQPAAAPDSLQDVVWRDLRVMLDREVQRLPSWCREPFVLCYMEGKTNEEAGRLLGCPTGTILSRLAKARELLRARLTRRGLTLSAGLIATMLSQGTVRSAVPGELALATIDLVRATVTCQVAVGLSTRVANLTEGVLRSMLMNKIKTAILVLVTLGLLGSGVGAVANLAFAGKSPTVAAALPKQAAKELAQTKQPPPPVEKVSRAAPRYRWVIYPGDGFGSFFSNAWRVLDAPAEKQPFYAGLVFFTELAKDGAYVVTMAHSQSPLGNDPDWPGYRPVAFDAARKRFPMESWGGGSAANVALHRYRLDPKVLPGDKVAFKGVEVLRPEVDKASAQQACDEAKKAGVEVLPLPEDRKAYDFTLTTTDGKKVNARDLRGKVVLIVCWAAADDNSKALLAEFRKESDKWQKNGVEIIGINFDDDPAKAIKACKDLDISWPQVMVPSDKKTRDLWRAATSSAVLPRVILLDREGILRADEFGEQFVHELEELMKE